MRRNGASKRTCGRSIVVSRNERATFQYFETASSAAKTSDLNTILLTPLNCSGVIKATDWFYINYHKFHMCRSRNSLFVAEKTYLNWVGQSRYKPKFGLKNRNLKTYMGKQSETSALKKRFRK